MSDIVREHSGSILTIPLNRPAKTNAMTSSMYIAMADALHDAATDDHTRVALWHGARHSFTAGNDLEDFMKHPPGPGDSPQARLINALIDFEKPLVAAVQGVTIGGGTTMLAHEQAVKIRERGVRGASSLCRSEASVHRVLREARARIRPVTNALPCARRGARG